MSTITVKTFVAPQSFVRMENVNINPTKGRFTLDLSLSADGIHYGEITQVSGTITPQLREWYNKPIKETVKVVADCGTGYEDVPTGKWSTGFQRYMLKTAFASEAFKENVIQDLLFESFNTSPDYKELPFRLFMGLDRNTLTLVNAENNVRREFVDAAGEVTVKYEPKMATFADGRRVRAFIHPDNYQRLVFENQAEREIFVD